MSNTPESTRRNVLRVIYNRGIVRGRDIKRIVQIESDELKTALDSLTKEKFVTTQTGSLGLESREEATDAYLSVLPSRKAAVEAELSQ